MRRALTTFVPALVWLAGVSVALLVPFPGELPMVVQAIPPWLERHGDKAIHAALFFVAAWLLARWFRRLPRVRRPLVAAVAVATLWGVGLELAQLRVPSRDGSLGDGLADLAGAALVVAVSRRRAGRAPDLHAAEDRSKPRPTHRNRAH
jgi:VanZ family protein